MSLKEAMEAVEAITARGRDAEIRRAKDGTYIVYEIKKNKVTCPE